MTSETIQYGRSNPILLNAYCIVHAAAKSPINYIKSYKKDPALCKGEVVALMCVWDEQENVEQALISSHEFVDKYIVVDKNGQTIPIIEETADKLGLDVRYYTKPELNLRDSRIFALEKTRSDWVLIQDGDEIFNHAKDEPNSISNLKKYLVYPNIILKTRMNILKLDYLHTQQINNAHHPFLLHNNGQLHFEKADIPRGKGRVINLVPIYKFNLSMVKPIKRIYYRHKFWRIHERSGLTEKYPSIEDFVENYLREKVLQEDIDNYEKELWKRAIPYNQDIQGPLPKVLRDIVKNGNVK